MTVREARPEDAAAIAHVHVHTWQTAYRGQLPDAYLDSLSVERRADVWKRVLAEHDPTTARWVAEDDDRIVGFAVAGPPYVAGEAEARCGELQAIYVLREHQGRGHGRILMDVATRWLADRYEQATLWVLETNDSSRRFYEHLGWRPDGGRKVDERPDAVLREVRYRVDLRSG